tara:strand:+ start:477 stop:809 length:333 start_codon:yes stop_codon:yes gene_type:complete
LANKAQNERIITLLDKLKHGRVVHIPHAIFPAEPIPPGGYWEGKICRTTNGGLTDIGVHIEGEPIFTRPKTEVVNWLVEVVDSSPRRKSSRKKYISPRHKTKHNPNPDEA